MSQENVEIVKAAYGAWNRGDIDAVLDHMHPDLEWEENPDVYPGLDRMYRGRSGFSKRVRDAFDVWEWARVEGQEFIDAGDEVVVCLRLVGKGRGSGVEVEMPIFERFVFRDGKVVHRTLHSSRAEALEAAGLSE
jgi:ketosteroid isomerase-like protein